MNRLILAAAGLLALSACSLTPTQEAQVTKVIQTTGADAQQAIRILCAIQTSASGALAAVADATATATAGTAAPGIIVLVGASKTILDAACKAMGGVPVVPAS